MNAISSANEESTPDPGQTGAKVVSDLDKFVNEIIRETIVTATLIDDDYVEAYDPSVLDPENEKLKKTRALFLGLRDNGCTPYVYQFINYDTWSSSNTKFRLLKGKDLLILDWELAIAGAKFTDALKVLSEAVKEEGLPFICIYTRTQPIEDVPLHIVSYFSGRSESDRDAIMAKIGDWALDHNIRGITEELMTMSSLFIEYIVAKTAEDREKRADGIRQAVNNLKWEGVKNGTGYASLLKYAQLECGLKDEMDFFVTFASKIKNGAPSNASLRTDILPIDGEALVYRINNSIVMILPSEEGDGKYQFVKPAALYKKLTEIIIKRDFLTLLSLEIRNSYRAKSMAVGRNVGDIDECAFFHHERNFLGDENEFRKFTQDLWESEMSLFYNDNEPKMHRVINEYKAQKAISAKLDKYSTDDGRYFGLGTLNYNLSIVRKAARNGPVRFGDIFRLDPAVFSGKIKNKGKANEEKIDLTHVMCVTPLCDCAHPDEIMNNYIFIGGWEIPLDNALEDPEQSYHSFVKKGNEVIAISWSRRHLFTVHIPKVENEIGKPILCKIRNVDTSLTFLEHLKTNYSQRVANDFLGWANRVGIGYATSKKK